MFPYIELTDFSQGVFSDKEHAVKEGQYFPRMES